MNARASGRQPGGDGRREAHRQQIRRRVLRRAHTRSTSGWPRCTSPIRASPPRTRRSRRGWRSTSTTRSRPTPPEPRAEAPPYPEPDESSGPADSDCCAPADPRIARQFDAQGSNGPTSTSFPTGRRQRRLLDLLRDAPRRRPTVLEFGCGTGGLSVALLEMGAARVTGIDLSPRASSSRGGGPRHPATPSTPLRRRQRGRDRGRAA